MKASLTVIGGGGAGMASALAAAECGVKDIVLVEKRKATGGTSAMASGIFAADSPAQRRQSIIAPIDVLFKRSMNWAHLSVNPRIVRAFMDKSGDTIRWLEEKGLYFHLVPHSPIDSPLTWHVPKGGGVDIMRTLAGECQQKGVKTILQSTAQKFLTGRQGEITGVIVKGQSGQSTIESESVVIATGGFAGNRELLKKYCPKYRGTMKLSGLPNKGEGISMAVDIGAATEGLGTIMIGGPFAAVAGKIFLGTGPDTVPVIAGFITGEPSVIWVNKSGRRFIDETVSFNYYESINALIQQPDGTCYGIFDKGTIQTITEKGFTHVPSSHGFGKKQRSPLPDGLEEKLTSLADKGTLRISESWDEIADWIGANREVLKNSITEYNEGCDRGYDPVFAKEKAYLRPLRTPPFYAVKCGSSLLNTIGGIKVNESMEVMNKDNNPIPGLYAAGVDVGGWSPDTYCAILPGTAFGFAINSGRIAGESAAGYISGLKR